MSYKREEKEKFLEVLRNKGFHIAKACLAYPIARKTFYEWCDKDDWFKQAYEDLKEEEIDDAELDLQKFRKGVEKVDSKGNHVSWIIEPNPTATIFFLKTKGKKRGYVERQEIVTDQGLDLKVTVVKSKRDKRDKKD